MNIWLHYNEDEKLVMLQQTAAAKNVLEQAIEKDFQNAYTRANQYIMHPYLSHFTLILAPVFAECRCRCKFQANRKASSG